MRKKTLSEQIKINLSRDLNNWETRDMTIKTYGLQPKDYTRIQLNTKDANAKLAHMKNREGFTKYIVNNLRNRSRNIVNNGNAYVPIAVNHHLNKYVSKHLDQYLYHYDLSDAAAKRVARQTLDTYKQRREQALKQIHGLSYPKPLKAVYTRASKILNSGITGYSLEKYTGINHSSIYRLRHPNGNQGRNTGLTGAALKTLFLLAGYPNKSIQNKFNDRVDKHKMALYLRDSAHKYHMYPNDIRADIANLFLATTNMTHLAKQLGIGRTKLEHMKSGRYHVMQLTANDTAKLIHAWQLVQNRLHAERFIRDNY